MKGRGWGRIAVPPQIEAYYIILVEIQRNPYGSGIRSL
jgi:hypothetical protein